MFSREYIEKKKQKLTEVRESLKNQFIGLDKIIDRIVDSIEVWYIIPDLLTNPLIVNLWGMTGVGKTDLVRKLARELDFENKFVEIQLNNDQFGRSIQEELVQNNILYEEQAILLLDEIQKFRSIDEEGKSKSNSNYSDIWELLSDGSFSDSHKERSKLQLLLIDLLFDKDEEEINRQEKNNKSEPVAEVPEKDTPKRKYKNHVWSASRFKMLTGSRLSIEEIMMLDKDEQIQIVEKRIKFLKSKREIKKFKKLLIFICGNIDEAYSMARNTTDIDSDADIINEKSKRINILDIKRELLSRFTPEQIARLGNNHIIYPSLSKQNFKNLISYKLETIKNKTHEISKINVTFHESINEAIYRNGVFPTQGVRPLFSTINLIIESILPDFLFKCLINKISEIEISADISQNQIICKSKDENFFWIKNVSFEIDSIRRNQSKNKISLISVHEAGHALVYMLLFKVVPKQICSSAVESFNNGFIIPHNLLNSKENIFSTIKVLLAGKVAEEIVFGGKLTTDGCISDYRLATTYASQLVRNSNMDSFVGTITNPYNSSSELLLTNIEETNNNIEQILKELKEEATTLLNNNIHILKLLIRELLKKNSLLSEDIFEIVKDKINGVKLISFDKTIEGSYEERLEVFLES